MPPSTIFSEPNISTYRQLGQSLSFKGPDPLDRVYLSPSYTVTPWQLSLAWQLEQAEIAPALLPRLFPELVPLPCPPLPRPRPPRPETRRPPLPGEADGLIIRSFCCYRFSYIPQVFVQHSFIATNWRRFGFFVKCSARFILCGWSVSWINNSCYRGTTYNMQCIRYYSVFIVIFHSFIFIV